MKKLTATKLTLHRETLRRLDNGALRTAAGGHKAVDSNGCLFSEYATCTITLLAGGCHVTSMTVDNCN